LAGASRAASRSPPRGRPMNPWQRTLEGSGTRRDCRGRRHLPTWKSRLASRTWHPVPRIPERPAERREEPRHTHTATTRPKSRRRSCCIMYHGNLYGGSTTQSATRHGIDFAQRCACAQSLSHPPSSGPPTYLAILPASFSSSSSPHPHALRRLINGRWW